jgi:hypothetical protein
MLSLAKHCCSDCSFFLNIHLVLSFPPYALMQKVEPKNQGKPKWLRLFCRPTHNNSLSSIRLFLSLLRSKQHDSVLFATFSKSHAFPSGVTNDRRCIPLPFS